jgi:DNA-binding MarR family transcriptional regulator
MKKEEERHEGLGSILREVARLQLQIQRSLAMECGGTTSTQCFIIGELGRGGRLTVAELGRRLSLDKGWVSRGIDALVEEGLVEKRPGEEDRRTVMVSLTEAGSDRYRSLNAALDAQAEGVMSRLPQKERARVAESLRLLRQALRSEAADAAERPSREDRCER